MFEKRGVDILAMFDTGEGMVGQSVAGIEVHSIDTLEDFCASHQVDIAVITCPKEQVREIAARLVACKVKGLWNYMGVELGYSPAEIVVENVHLGDSLMILNYKIASRYQNEDDELTASDDSITDLSESLPEGGESVGKDE
jgi:redox-sensing transcriptional repressor